jgi:GxxExxY protein
MENQEFTHAVIGAAFAVHKVLGFGFVEKVYENALTLELRKRGMDVQQQYPISVYYDDEIVGDFKADLMVNQTLLVEIKSVTKIVPEHEVQLVNYLNGTRLPFGLLINFGTSVEVKRKYKDHKIL